MAQMEAPRAWGLTRGMARALGLDLVGAVTEGWLNRGDLAGMIETCENCDQSRRCTEYLARTLQTDAVPAYCHNARALDALRP